MFKTIEIVNGHKILFVQTHSYNFYAIKVGTYKFFSFQTLDSAREWAKMRPTVKVKKQKIKSKK